MRIFSKRSAGRTAAATLSLALTAGIALALPTAATAASETTGDIVITADPSAPGSQEPFYAAVSATTSPSYNYQYALAGGSVTYSNLTPGKYSVQVGSAWGASSPWLGEYISPNGANNYSANAYDPAKILSFSVVAGETTQVKFAPTLDIPANYAKYTVKTVGALPETSVGLPIMATFGTCDGGNYFTSASQNATESSVTNTIPAHSCIVPTVSAIGAAVKDANGFVNGVGAPFTTVAGGNKSVSFEQVSNGTGGFDVPIYSVVPSFFMLSSSSSFYVAKYNSSSGEYDTLSDSEYQVGFDLGEAASIRNLEPGKYQFCTVGIPGGSILDLTMSSINGGEARCVGNEKFNVENPDVSKSKSFEVKANKVTTLEALDFGNFGGPGKILRTSGKATISGKAEVGSTLTGTSPQWETYNVKKNYQWLADGTPIAGATASTYRLTANDAGKAISLAVSATKLGWAAGLSVSTPTAKVARLNFAPTSALAITGTAKVANTLSVKAPVWNTTGVTTKYQWLANGTAISGATSTSYTVTAADAGKVLTVRTTATKAGYNTVTLNSAGTAKVAKSTATVTGKLKKTTIKASKSTSITVTVKTPGVAKPTGTVVVKVGSKTVKASLKASNAGKIRVTLKGKSLKVGKNQKVTVQFVPSGSTASAVEKSAVVSAGKLTVTKK